jgi:dipeptidyl aminopeptidase/acylaminoacyl peptidase
MRRFAVTLALLVWAGSLPAQGPAPRFTVTDVLDTRQLGAVELSPDGRQVLAGVGSLRDRIGIDNTRFGDPTYVPPGVAELRVIELATGKATPLVAGKRQATGFAWSPDGARLAFLLREGDAGRLAVWERSSGRVRTATLPRDREVSAQIPVQWTPDGKVLFTMRTSAWREEARRRFVQETDGPVIVRTSDEPFLSWDAIRRLGLRQIPALWEVAADRVTELGAEAHQDGFGLSEDGAWLRWQEDITEKTDYAEIFGRVNRLKAKRLAGGDPVTLFASTKGVTIRWSGDGLTYVHAKDGTMSVSRLGDTAVRKLSALPPATPDSLLPKDTTARRVAGETREKERFSPVQVSHRGDLLVASNSEGLWLFETATGNKEKIVDLPEEAKQPEAPRYAVAAWSRDGRDLYLSYASRTGWERGFVRYDRAAKQLVPLVRDAHLYGELQLSADGRTAVFSRAPGNQVPDLYAAGRDLAAPRRLTELNPGLEAKVGRTALVEYRDADGRPLKGVLYYPLDYREGTKYPTVFIVYESFFDDRFNGTVALLNAHGYAVMQPSVHLVQGYPGEAWLKGVTAAANRLIDLGVADPKRLGVHGTSYGGYATNLLVAQTDRFAAAINISGKADMISFYTDSPRLGTRNTHAPEKSQDRIGGTLWEQPLKYLEHSAVMMADRIKTPLLLLTGREDHNVPERTTSEMFYALRRLERRVEWVSYVTGGHGMPTARQEDVEDYHQRILGWYDRHLKGEK